VNQATPVVDIVLGLQTPEVMKLRPDWGPTFFGEKIGVKDEVNAGLSLDDHVSMLDRAGIDHALVLAQIAGSPGHPESYSVPPELVAEVVQKHPTRFSGLAGVDPTAGMAGVRALERAVTEFGFVGAHGYPHWFDLAPDDPRWYPIYSKCCELDIPIQLQVGHCLVYSKKRPLRSVGRPITLDTVACHFPELKLVGIHIGWPWAEEMIAMAYKHENVYIGSDAYAPKHWPAEFVRYLDSFGAGKVMFGTDFPVIHPERAVREIEQLPIRDASRAKLMGGTAVDLYNLTLDAPTTSK
jgi:predicted TIM-barrel fold metal-dependent hydrolase